MFTTLQINFKLKNKEVEYMKKLRKIMATMLCVAVILTMAPMTFVIAHTDENISIVIDGVAQSYDVKVFTKEGRTLAPMDDLFTALGAQYNYDNETKVITASVDDFTVTLEVDSNIADSSRLGYKLEAAPEIVNGTVMVPVRFVAEQLGFKVEWVNDTQTVNIKKLVLISDKPETEGQRIALAKSKQLTDFTYVPVKDIPCKTIDTATGNLVDIVLEAGVEYTGFPYSSNEVSNMFLCENITFETYLSALANPDSVLYTKDLYAYRNGSSYYGIVCNGLVRYAYGINHMRYNTKYWMDIPGMVEVAPVGQHKVEDLKLADSLHGSNSAVNHNALITDILRDENGEIVMVEVSEALYPTCRRRKFTVEDYYKEFGKNYRVARYEYLESIPPVDEYYDDILNSDLDKVTPAIAVDYGHKSNIPEGSEIVISSFAEGKNTVQIIKDGKLIEEVKVDGYTKITRTPECGYYTVKLKNTDYSTEFCIVAPVIAHSLNNNVITINASSADSESKISHMEFRNAISGGFASLNTMIHLTDEEKASGVFTREIPSDAVTYRVSFKNDYGVWTHQVIDIQNPGIYTSYTLDDGYSYKSKTIYYEEGTAKPLVTSVNLVDKDAKYDIIHEDEKAVIRVYDEKGYKDWYIPYAYGEKNILNYFDDASYTEYPVVNVVEDATHSDAVWAEGICDNDYSTRWGCTNIGESIVLDLGESKEITHFAVAQWLAKERTFYYQVLVSEDGVNYTLVKDVTSYAIDGANGTLQLFEIEPSNARYVKVLNSGGNSASKSQNFYEFKVLKLSK